MKVNPTLLGWRATDRRGRVPHLQQPGCDGRRAREGRDRRRTQRSDAGIRTPRDDRGNRRAVKGKQGGFDEIAINGGAGLKKPHPALLDKRVRVAIAHAIDKQTLIDRVYEGIGTVVETVSPSPDPAWMPEIPEAEQFAYDPEMSKQILDDAGYVDTDGDGVREMPGGGEAARVHVLRQVELRGRSPRRASSFRAGSRTSASSST